MEAGLQLTYCTSLLVKIATCYNIAHLDILGTCTEILDTLALDILDLDILGLIRFKVGAFSLLKV